MEKVHAFMAVLLKYHFWVLCGVILIASTVVWMIAIGNVEDEAERNLQQIKASLNNAKQVKNVTQHPNDQIISAYNQQTEALKQEVLQVWSVLYKKQRDTVLQWPPALGESFIKHVDNTPFLGFIPVDLRDIYFNYVKTRWAELPKIIKAKAVSSEGSSDRRAPAASGVRRATPDYIVDWVDQERIRKSLFSVVRPTVEWVWLTQEDIWIYENLLNIIKKTNAGAIGPHNAVISTINSMDVGKSAAQDASGTGQRVAPSDGAGTAAGGDSGGSEGGSGLLNGRYVDGAGLPLENGVVAKDGEYKRIPVRLVLRMDSREIPQLILSCSNAPLPVEVQQVKINVNAAEAKSVKGPDLSAEDRAAGRKTPHVEVSIQGVIYIFNPPSLTKLNLPETSTTGVGSATEAFGTDPGTETSPTPPMFEEDSPAPPATDPAATTPIEAAPAIDPTAPVETTTPAATPALTPATTPAGESAKPDPDDLFK